MFRWEGSRKARRPWISAWISAWLSLVPGAALAQPAVCQIPPRIDLPTVERPSGSESRSVAIRSYTLALSWSPEFCRSHADDPQCDAANGRFGFIIHGLWPEGDGRDRPQWCPAVPVPAAVARDQFCAMPSARLIAHEWAKHGSCATRNPADYFAASRTLFGAIRFPDMNALSRRPLDVGAFKRLLSAANPIIQPSALIVLNDRSGGWLREVYVCLSARLKPQPCSRGANRGAPDGSKLRIWRDER